MTRASARIFTASGPSARRKRIRRLRQGSASMADIGSRIAAMPPVRRPAARPSIRALFARRMPACGFSHAFEREWTRQQPADQEWPCVGPLHQVTQILRAGAAMEGSLP